MLLHFSPKLGIRPGGHYKVSKKSSKAHSAPFGVLLSLKRQVRSVHGRVARPKPTSNNILKLWSNITPSSASIFLVRNYLDSWESLRSVFLWVSNWARVENPSNVSIWPQKDTLPLHLWFTLRQLLFTFRQAEIRIGESVSQKDGAAFYWSEEERKLEIKRPTVLK